LECRLAGAASISEAGQCLLGILVIRHDLEGFAVVGARGGLVAQLLMHRAAAHIGFGITRIELDRHIEIGDGALVLALIGVGQSAVEKSARIVAVEPDRVEILVRMARSQEPPMAVGVTVPSSITSRDEAPRAA